LLPSLAIVLTQEMVKFNRLLSTMTRSLSDVKRAIQGFIVMSADLDQMYNAFMNNQLPALFEKVSFASLKTLASWNADLLFRVDFFRFWLTKGQPACFPLPAFFFPQGFMTGTLQTFARKYQVSIEQLGWAFTVSDKTPKEVTEGPEDGILCHGMFSEGAGWDWEKMQIKISEPGEMFVPLPMILFVPESEHVPDPALYAMPCYKTAARKGVLSTTGMSTNFVVPIELPTDVDPDIWTLYGAAALLNLTD
jgi:dynein heavy chain